MGKMRDTVFGNTDAEERKLQWKKRDSLRAFKCNLRLKSAKFGSAFNWCCEKNPKLFFVIDSGL